MLFMLFLGTNRTDLETTRFHCMRLHNHVWVRPCADERTVANGSLRGDSLRVLPNRLQ